MLATIENGLLQMYINRILDCGSISSEKQNYWIQWFCPRYYDNFDSEWYKDSWKIDFYCEKQYFFIKTESEASIFCEIFFGKIMKTSKVRQDKKILMCAFA